MARSHVFVSYSHKDHKWLDELNTSLQPHLRNFQNDTFVYWDDNQIQAGSRWRDEIETALSSAKIAVLLVSANYLASRFIATAELPAIFKFQSEDGLRIFWIPVSASAYNVTDLKDYQAACDPMRPLDTLSKAQRSQSGEYRQSVADSVNRLGSEPAPDGAADETPEEGNVVLLYVSEMRRQTINS